MHRSKTDEDRIYDIFSELRRAEKKFPGFPVDPLHALAVVQEEVGELQKAILQAVYEPDSITIPELEKEAVQMAAMAIRFVCHLNFYCYASRSNQRVHVAAKKET